MKNFTLPAFISFFFLLLILCLNTSAQQIFPGNFQKVQKNPARTTGSNEKCGTMQWLDNAFRMYPNFLNQYNDNERRLAEFINQKVREQQNNPNNRIQAIITIPVVFHVVLNAAGQASITDAKILAQLDTLNHDFSGLNGDSANIPAAFQAVRGHSNLRFCLAQRTPADLPTTGIVRVTSNTVSNLNPGSDPVKSTATGGSDAWDPTKYLNIWLSNMPSPFLGYATFPPGSPEGAGIPLNQQGVVVLAQTIPGGTEVPFNKGRTLTHEAGHFFWLRHIWGDGAGCADDFPGTPGIDDTPAQNNETFGCPNGALAPGCGSPNPPGRMYQNFMDYTDDACMTMFTIGQGIRGESAINLYRPGLLTSNGCTPPPPSAGNDARISTIITPATGGTLGCTSVVPVVTIQNVGSNTLTSAFINVRLDGVAVGSPIPWTGSLTQGSSASVTLPSLAIAAVGAHTIKIHTTVPNGQTDAVPANDTATSAVTRIAASPIPVTNGFETTLLPAGWSLNNPTSPALVWVRFNPTVAAGGTFAARIDNYNIDGLGTVDDIVTPVINTATVPSSDSLQISFDLAYKNFPDPQYYDSLKVMVTINCGATWTTIWQRGGPGLATAGASDQEYIPASLSDWKTQKVSIGNNLFGGGQVQVAFRNVGFFGNILWLDNINIDIKPKKDMSTTAILRPNATECAPPFAPSITVRNAGGENVTGFKTGYILNGGTPVIQAHNIPLAPGESATITFANLNPPAGNNTIKMFVTDPISSSSGPDAVPVNDTLTRTFAVPTTVINVIQGFEGTTFIPANWTLLNPNNNVTWIRKTPGKGSDYSAFIDNYNNPIIGQIDIMQTPPVNITGTDGATITFDVAHKNYDDGSIVGFDSLRILASTDCGATFTSVYSKAGPTLATAGSTAANYTNPLQNEWRNETISLTGLTGNNVLVRFENTNDYGNNIFIDNINIVPLFKRDLEVVSVSPDIVCTPAYTPSATIRNKGTETVTGYKVSYSVGGGAPVTTTFTGVTLAPNATVTVPLTAGTLAAGVNAVKIYAWDPVTVSGTGDQYRVNDTLSKTSYVSSAVSSPLVETFEGNFIPTGWAINNPDGATTWQKSGVGFISNGSAYLKNFGYLSTSQKDGLFTPVLGFTGVDSVKVTFDLSAATRVAATGSIAMDTLEVLVTKDCGNTFTSVYKKGGTELQTIFGNTPVPTEYTPNASYLWRKETIDLTSFRPDGPLQLVFRNTTNNQNNIFVDNVNFSTRTLPPRLRTEGYIITPSPFSEQFNIWFVQAPADLRYVTIYNSAGQLMWNKVFGSGGSTSNVINVDMTGKAAGIYVVNFGFSDKSKDKQVTIIKAQ